MNKILILKTNGVVPFTDRDALLERARGEWKISVQKIIGVKRAVLLYQGAVLEEYEIGDKLLVDLSQRPPRLTFDLSIVEDSKLRGLVLDYPTANPASVAEVENLKIKE
jgi:hypothetical protein